MMVECVARNVQVVCWSALMVLSRYLIDLDEDSLVRELRNSSLYTAVKMHAKSPIWRENNRWMRSTDGCAE